MANLTILLDGNDDGFDNIAADEDKVYEAIQHSPARGRTTAWAAAAMCGRRPELRKNGKGETSGPLGEARERRCYGQGYFT